MLPPLRSRRVLALLLAVLAASSGCGTPAPAHRDSARLRVVRGAATVEGAEAPRTISAPKEEAVDVGNTVRTGEATEAVVVSGSIVQVVGPNSSLKLEALGESTAGLSSSSLLSGVATFFLPSNPAARKRFEVRSTHVVAAVKGTVFRIEVTAAGTRVLVVKGLVELTAPPGATLDGSPRDVKAGEQADITGSSLKVTAAASETITAIQGEMLSRRVDLGLEVGTFY